ncbi:Serpentine Receptor, class H [Caenorhabditis elegans]|uniref:Serpentine Receptor, class H n=1 Tax=Caenorhabditis elegans TaxID=6239 RepID=Q9XV29_CAEEL|nr:Serpentine Receptor, class H [Caenorhabditis elegans]CAB04365.1 Serpentine Receptor, class H [Caenorhabditis elegans]|eukprot:NP_507348.1 Serpentine Receptor, class H [Caenorhabditis elegans]
MWPDSRSSLPLDTYYAGILHILTCIEIPLHTFGAYLIVAKTPKKMRMVKASMLMLHFSGAIVDFYLSFISIPVLTLPVCSGYPLGFSLVLGIPTSVQVYIGVSCMGVIGVTILVFFENRYFQLINGSSGRRSWKRKLYVLCNYAFSATFIAPAFLDIPSEEQGRTYTFEKIPSIPIDVPSRPGYFVLLIDNPTYSICVSLLVIIVCPQIGIVVLFIFRFIVNTKSHSRATQRLLLHFFIAMCIQLSIPFLVIFLPAAFIVYAIQYDYYNQAANNLAMATMAFHGVCTTLTMIIVHTPYRNATLSILHLKSEKSAKIVNDSNIVWKTNKGLQMT